MVFRRRALVRGAMVGGAAYYAGRKVAQGEQREADQDYQLQQLQAQQAQQQYAPPPQQYAAPPPQYAPAIAATPPPAPPAPAQPTMSAAEQLTDLKKLLDAGVLTQEEFDVEKAKVLRGI
jgi:hypothetical protein